MVIIALMVCCSLFATTYRTSVLDDFNEPTGEYYYVCRSDSSEIEGNLAVFGCSMTFAVAEEAVVYQVWDGYGNDRAFLQSSEVSLKIKGTNTDEIVELNFVDNHIANNTVTIWKNSEYYAQIVNLFKANTSVKVSVVVPSEFLVVVFVL